MKTLKQLLKELISSSDISGAFDAEGVITDVYVSGKAEREIACWYMADGELLAEATAGNEVELAGWLKSGGAWSFGHRLIQLCEQEALQWAKANEWGFVESELTKDWNAKPEPDDNYSSFRDDVFSALDPVAITKAMEGK